MAVASTVTSALNQLDVQDDQDYRGGSAGSQRSSYSAGTRRAAGRKRRKPEAAYSSEGATAGAYQASDKTVEAKDTVVVNISSCKGPMMEIVTEVLSKKPSCELVDDYDRKNCDLYIVMTREELKKRIKSMGKRSVVSKFPAMYNMCSNNTFAQCMSFATRLLPGAHGVKAPFWPETFRIPEQLKEIRGAMDEATRSRRGGSRAPAWIVKPSLRGENNQGMVLDQIFLTTSCVLHAQYYPSTTLVLPSRECCWTRSFLPRRASGATRAVLGQY